MPEKHSFSHVILREYDIRGIVGQDLNPADALATGAAFGTIIVRDGGKTVCVGCDGRTSSPALKQALMEGLASTGLEVIDLGRGPTPMVYYGVKHLQTDAGVMITGSHNPANYNGIKMVRSSGAVYGDAIQTIGKMAAAGDYATGQGSIRSQDIKDAYIARMLKDYAGPRPLKVVWDIGNGATGDLMPEIAKRLPGEHILLFPEVDGTFPNHHPDPTVAKNMVDLQKAVIAHKADLGIAFDGDGDRVGAVDHTGKIVWGDQLLAIYSTEVLKDMPGATIICDVKASQTLYDEVARLGGTPLMWKTGHSLIKAKMQETHSPLAGEVSGHIFFGHKYYGFDDAIYCGIRLVSLVSASGQTLADLAGRLPKVFNTPEVRFQADESRKFKAIEEIHARLMAQKAAHPEISVNDIDGVRVNTPEGWWLLRASNTQDVLVGRAESLSEEGLAKLIGMIEEQLAMSGINPPDSWS